MTGKVEPWDSGRLYYLISLILSGVITGALNAKYVSLVYLGTALSQICFLNYFLPYPPSQYFGIGVISIWFFSSITLGSNILVSYVKSKIIGE